MDQLKPLTSILSRLRERRRTSFPLWGKVVVGVLAKHFNALAERLRA
jgi:hypothetical protein